VHYINSRAMAMTFALETVDEELQRSRQRALTRRAERRALRDQRRAERSAVRQAPSATQPTSRHRWAHALHPAH
jgi:hypothetical protein